MSAQLGGYMDVFAPNAEFAALWSPLQAASQDVLVTAHLRLGDSYWEFL